MIGRKTSFEAVIESFDSDTPAHWPLKGRSLPYSRLQSCMEASTSGQPELSQDNKQTDFISELRKEVHLIDRLFIDEAQRILKAYDRSNKPKFGAFRSLICPGVEAQQRARLADDISWCQQYAAINKIGLQRLVEQHDRCHNSSAGAAFFEDCSRPGSSVGIFLKSPLLRKVAELQRSLIGLQGDKDQIVLGVLTSRQHSHSTGLPKARALIPASAFRAGWGPVDLRGSRHGRHARSGPIPAL